MIETEVDAPGDAPRSAAMDPSAEETTSVPNCRNAPTNRIFLDDLDALASNLKPPVVSLGRGYRSLENLQPVLW